MMGALTVGELVDLLDPPLTVMQVKCLITLMNLPPCGRRLNGSPGRPVDLYDAKKIMAAHADMVKHQVKAR